MDRRVAGILIGLLSGTVVFLLVRALWSGEAEPETVELHDNTAEIQALLATHAEEAASEPGAAGLVRFPLSEREAKKIFPGIKKGHVYDPLFYERHPSHLDQWRPFREHPNGGWRMRTNGLGLREDTEVAAEKPDVRVLVVGDSHVDGVCENSESYPNLLERMLGERHPDKAIEVLNAATGGWSFYNYLGALEAFLDLDPDAFVVTVYGGNDFSGAISLHHYFRGERGRAPEKKVRRKLLNIADRHVGLPAQFFNQVAYFEAHPEEVAAATEMAALVSEEMRLICAREGIALVGVYLPAMAEIQPGPYLDQLEPARRALSLSPAAEAVTGHLGDAWLGWLRDNHVPCVDLREDYGESDEPLYWRKDHHINLEGHRVAARAVLPVLEEALGLGR